MEKYDHQHEMGDIEGPSSWQLQADLMIEEFRRDQDEFLARLREAANNRYKPLPTQPEVETPRHKEMEDVHEELPTQPEVKTPRRQEVEHVHQEPQSKVSTGPVLARRPTQNHQRVPTLHQRLQKAQYLSNQERQMRWMAENNSALDRAKLRDMERKLQEERSLRLKREEEVQMLKEQIKSLSPSPRALPAEPMDESAKIKDFKGQLQTEVLKKQQEVKAPFIETVSKDQEMEDMKELQREACKEVTARQLEDLRRKQEEKTKFYLELVQSLQEENAALKKEMEKVNHAVVMTVTTDMEVFRILHLKKAALSQKEMEDMKRLQLEDLRRQQKEKTKSNLEPVQSLQEGNAGLTEEAPEKKLEFLQQQKKPSRWRRFKKSITPNPLRKNKNKDQE